MESFSSVSEGVSQGLVDAESLRDMTISKEDLFLNQKNGILDQIMTSMVSQATINGGFVFSTQLNPQFDRKMLDEIEGELKTLNYKTEIKDGEFQDQKVILLHISWEKEDVSDRPEE